MMLNNRILEQIARKNCLSILQVHVVGSFDPSKGVILKSYSFFNLILKTMYCNYQIIISIGGQQYLSVNYILLLHIQMQI